MASFQAKTRRERLRMCEKKFLVLIHSNSAQNREFQKNIKKMQKLKKPSLWLHFKPKQYGTGWEWEKKKIPTKKLPKIASKSLKQLK